jgi:predicted enzyme related to lactoylglutathione lyase
MGAPVVWFEFGGRNGRELQQFYGDLFGWKIDANNPAEYGTVDTDAGGAGIPGGVWAAGDKAPADLGEYVTVFVGVPDLDSAVAKAEGLGAKTVVSRWDIPEGPTVAYVRDPEGHMFGLIQTAA